MISTTRVAIYVRVSTDKQDAENQMHDLKSYCDRMGYKDVAAYRDTMTGSKADRKNFVWMMQDARLRKFDLLLFWSLDRFTREGALETLQHLRVLDSFGVHWRSHQESFLDSTGPLKDAVVGFIATIAKMERQRIIDRTQASIRRRREKGLPLGRPKAIFDREQVKQCRAKGMSIRELAKEFGVGVGTIHRTLAG